MLDADVWILSSMASSSRLQLHPYMPMAIITQTDAADSNATWLPPIIASLPKHFMTSASMITNTAIGIADTHAAGWRKLLFFLNFGIIIPFFVRVRTQI